MTSKITITNNEHSSPSTGIDEDVYINNDLIFNKIICQSGEVISFHDAIASVLKGKYLSKVYHRKDMTTAFRWFYSLEDALACYGLGIPDYRKSEGWREAEKRHHESLEGFRISQAQSMQKNYQSN